MRYIDGSIGRTMLATAGAFVVGAALLTATLAPSAAEARPAPATPGTMSVAHR